MNSLQNKRLRRLEREAHAKNVGTRREGVWAPMPFSGYQPDKQGTKGLAYLARIAKQKEAASTLIPYERIAQHSGNPNRFRKGRPVISPEMAAAMRPPFPPEQNLACQSQA